MQRRRHGHQEVGVRAGEGVAVTLITAVVIIGGDFHLFSYVAYYPALALFAVVFPHLWLSLAWATIAGAIYAVVSLMVGPGLDFDAGQEKALLARVMAMYGVVASVSVRFERVRRQESAERERELQRERIETLPDHSRHGRADRLHDQPGDTPGHQADRGIERGAHRHAGRHRHAVEGGRLGVAASPRRGAPLRGEGAGPGPLVAHRDFFAGLVDPRLFSIAHNALTNAFLHAHASSVEVRGFRGMRADAERLGGRLIVESGGDSGGTTVTCETPYR